MNTNDLSPERMSEEQFSIFINFDNALEERGDISDLQFHQSEIDENELHEEFTLQNMPSHIEINNACDVIRRFLETKPNSDYNSFYNVENPISDMMLLQKSNKETKSSNYFTRK